MKLSELSVKRPVFATVFSLLLVILGLLSASRLAIRELPDVESPVVSIETNYLGASADVVETKITQVIEDRVAGLEGVTKITSQSIDGRSSINLEFDPDRDGSGADRSAVARRSGGAAAAVVAPGLRPAGLARGPRGSARRAPRGVVWRPLPGRSIPRPNGPSHGPADWPGFQRHAA